MSIETATFDSFLKRSKEGMGLTYQLHRKMGGVFIDAVFSLKDSDELKRLETFRIQLPEPKLIQNELKWDEHGFPFEVETYQVGSLNVETAFYRPLTEQVALSHFLEDVVTELDEDTAPTEMVDAIENITEVSEKIVDYIDEIQNVHELSDQEKAAIDVFFGNSNVWNCKRHWSEDLTLALAEYLLIYIRGNREEYERARNKAEEKRHLAFEQLENQLVNNYIARLEQCGFRQGYVRSKA